MHATACVRRAPVAKGSGTDASAHTLSFLSLTPARPLSRARTQTLNRCVGTYRVGFTQAAADLAWSPNPQRTVWGNTKRSDAENLEWCADLCSKRARAVANGCSAYAVTKRRVAAIAAPVAARCDMWGLLPKRLCAAGEKLGVCGRVSLGAFRLTYRYA